VVHAWSTRARDKRTDPRGRTAARALLSDARMKHAIWIGILALAFGACGSKSSCEKVLKRAVECRAGELTDRDPAVKEKALDFADDMIGEMCKDKEIADGAAELADCASESDCAAFNACIEKKAPGLGLLGE
jgi:hypothetical protein